MQLSLDVIVTIVVSFLFLSILYAMSSPFSFLMNKLDCQLSNPFEINKFKIRSNLGSFTAIDVSA